MTRARWIASIFAAFALLAGITAGVAAQNEGTPSAGNQPHPAHIHEGTCAELGDVVYPLNDVSGDLLSATPGATPAAPTGAESGSVIGQSQTEVDASLDDLLAGDFAVNVHKSAEEIDVYIACGEISGEAEDDTLIIDLTQQNDSGVAGQVVLNDLGDGKTMVTVTLNDATAPADASPAATPTS